MLIYDSEKANEILTKNSKIFIFYRLSVSFIIHDVIFLYCFYVNILEFLKQSKVLFLHYTCRHFNKTTDKELSNAEGTTKTKVLVHLYNVLTGASTVRDITRS